MPIGLTSVQKLYGNMLHKLDFYGNYSVHPCCQYFWRCELKRKNTLARWYDTNTILSERLHTVALKGHHYISFSLHYINFDLCEKILCDYVYIIILHVYIIILHVYINILHVYIIILHVYIIILHVYINILHVYISIYTCIHN